MNFKVVSGPNAGRTQDVALSADGVANFTFTSAVGGTDVVEASLTLPDICYSVYNGGPQAHLDSGDPTRLRELLPAGAFSCRGFTVPAARSSDRSCN